MRAGLILKEIRVLKGLNQQSFADSLQITRSNLSHIESGRIGVGLDIAALLATNFNVDLNVFAELLTKDEALLPKLLPKLLPNGKNEVEYVDKTDSSNRVSDLSGTYTPKVITVDRNNDDAITVVPMKAAAGYLNGFGDPDYIENLPTLYIPGYREGLHRGFEIRGNSMPPVHSGAISIGRYVESLSDITNRYVYIILSKYEGLVLKRVINKPDDQKLILISDNPNKNEFPTYDINYDEVQEIWQWRGAVIRQIPDPSSMYDRMNDMEARLALLEGSLNQMKGKNELTIKLKKP